MSSDAVRPEVVSDARFSRVSFPSLRDNSHDRGTVRSHALGHAAGYAAGLHAANAEVERLKADLYAEHDTAVRAEQARLDRAVAVLTASARALNERTLPVIADVQDSLVAAALELAEAILGYELSSIDNSARSALIRATTLVDPKIAHTVRMNPEDLAVLDDLAVLEETTRGSANVAFVADASLSRGDALTEFPDGYLDARISTALARAKDVLVGGVQ